MPLLIRKMRTLRRLQKKRLNRLKLYRLQALEEKEKRKDMFVGASRMQSVAPTRQTIIVKAVFSLRVANTKDAAGEVDKILKKFEAKNIDKQTSNRTVFLTAEIKAQKMNEFVAQLKKIGRVEGKDMPLDSVEGDISVVIEIVSN